jgi:hypothetical protein
MQQWDLNHSCNMLALLAPLTTRIALTLHLRAVVTQISYNLFQNISHNFVVQLSVRAKYKYGGRQ